MKRPLNGGGSISSVPTVLWLVEDAAGDDRRGRRLEGLGGRTKLLPYLENQSTITLRERQSRRPNHAGELRQPAAGAVVDRQSDRQMMSGPGRGGRPRAAHAYACRLHREKRISSFIRYNTSAYSCWYVPFYRPAPTSMRRPHAALPTVRLQEFPDSTPSSGAQGR